MNCEVCTLQSFKYKCPKCQLKYCSLACYKTHKVIHEQEVEAAKPCSEDLETTKSDAEPLLLEPTSSLSASATAPVHLKPLPNSRYQKLVEENNELKDLLSYNTVKYHLHKVYKILTIPDGASTAAYDTEKKQQLAVDYLNTLRNGGIHHNEAIEEFIQIVLANIQ